MTSQAGHARIAAFGPAWTQSLDAMARNLAQARSRCRRCHSLLHVDPACLRATLDGAASLIDRSAPCAVVGCGGTVCYLAAPATGAAYHVLTTAPALLDRVIDLVCLPFRSRWHGEVPIAPLPAPIGN